MGNIVSSIQKNYHHNYLIKHLSLVPGDAVDVSLHNQFVSLLTPHNESFNSSHGRARASRTIISYPTMWIYRWPIDTKFNSDTIITLI